MASPGPWLAIAANVTAAADGGVPGEDLGYGSAMTNVKEGLPDPDEGFHEQTPQEFAEQPDPEFTRAPRPDEEPDADTGRAGDAGQQGDGRDGDGDGEGGDQ